MTEAECTRLVVQRATHDEIWTGPLCEYCGYGSAHMERHHRLFRSHGGLWVPSNIVLLCIYCHVKTTNEELDGSGLNVRSYEDPKLVPVSVWYAGMVLLDDEGGYEVLDTNRLTMPDNDAMF